MLASGKRKTSLSAFAVQKAEKVCYLEWMVVGIGLVLDGLVGIIIIS